MFVRFEFDLPTDQLKERLATGRVVFALVDGGLIDWFILSSWCRSQGLGAVEIANRKRIVFFSRPGFWLKYVLGRASYADAFLSPRVHPRLICLSGRERKKINVPTPSEALLAEIYSRASATGELAGIYIVPVFILWRRHMRGGARLWSEYLLGLSSKPHVFGKIWYLLRRRTDSSVRALGFLPLASKESLEKLEGFDENEAMRAAKSARRKVLVWVQQEMRVLLGPRYHSPSLVKETVLRDPQVQELISRLAKEQGVDRKKLMSQAYQNLTEIAADYHVRLIEVLYVFLNWLFSKVFDGIDIKESEWLQVREIMKNKPVAFVPCHRSHLDYLVIPYVLFRHDMVTPHIAAGINLSFWPVGHFLRRGGAFFIRRSFRGEELYQLLLAKYVQNLLKNRYNLKFFIEGTRSRSGKMLAPAYGMLKMVMEAHSNHVCEDVVLVPVSLCYDEVPEQGTYSRELGGGQKAKESALGLLKSRKLIQRRFGKVYVRLAPPISTKAVFEGAEKDPRRRLQKTAFQICKSICDKTPITPKSLVSTVLLCHRNPLLSLEEILRVGLVLGHYVRHAGLELSVPSDAAMRLGIERTVRRLRKSGVLLQVEDVPRRYLCEGRKRQLLSFYKNNAVHCLVVPSIALLSFYRSWENGADRSHAEMFSDFQSQALRLRDLLKFEFFFNPRVEFLEELDHSARFLFSDLKAPFAEWKRNLKERFVFPADLSVLSRLVGDLIESYAVFFEFVRTSTEGEWEKKAMLAKACRFAELRQQNGEIFFPESVSVMNYGNALSYLENRAIVKIDRDGEKTTVSRLGADVELDALIAQLSDYRRLMRERADVALNS